MSRAARVLAAIFVLLIAGCGSDDEPDDGATGPTATKSSVDAPDTSSGTTGAPEPGDVVGDDDAIDVCALLSAEEVQGVLGEPATPTDQSTGSMYACSWEGESDALNVLSVSVYVHPDAATAKEMYDATKEGLGGSEIMGLGDEASYADAFGLEVLSGRYDISVDNTGPTEKESDLTIAKRILELLP